MRFLRRPPARAVESGSAVGPDGAGDTRRSTGKGRPTPKRRDAEGRRRGPAPPPPRTQREAIRLAKQNRASRAEQRKAAAERRGKPQTDEKALPPRDRGPVKAFVRDHVDSRRHLMGLFLPLAGLVFLALLAPQPYKNLANLVGMAMLLSMGLEGVLLGWQITRAVRQRFPDERISGLSIGWYAFSRAFQLRRLRIPKPRVGYGAKV